MSDLKIEADLSIAKLDLQPGDILIAKWNRHAGDVEQAWAYEQLRRVVPHDVEILIGGPDIDLSVMRPGTDRVVVGGLRESGPRE